MWCYRWKFMKPIKTVRSKIDSGGNRSIMSQEGGRVMGCYGWQCFPLTLNSLQAYCTLKLESGWWRREKNGVTKETEFGCEAISSFAFFVFCCRESKNQKKIKVRDTSVILTRFAFVLADIKSTGPQLQSNGNRTVKIRAAGGEEARRRRTR